MNNQQVNFVPLGHVWHSESLSGRAVIGFARHATEEGIVRQLAHIRRQTGKAVAKLVGLYDQQGGPSHIDDTVLDQIIRRKQEADDFDVLLVTDMSRLTRAGVTHCSALERHLCSLGIAVFACDWDASI